MVAWPTTRQSVKIAVVQSKIATPFCSLLLTHALCAHMLCAGPGGEPAIILATQHGHTKCIAELVRLGADVNWAEPSMRCTALHLASRYGHVAVVRELARLGANVNAEDKEHRTPLHSAACNGHTLTTVELVRLGADMKTTNQEGSTPLLLASMQSHSETVEALQKLSKEKQLKKKQLKHNKSKPEQVESQGSPGDKTEGKELFVGATVEMHSVKAADLSGQNGKLVEWDAKKQRWQLQLVSGRELVAKPNNLRRVILSPEEHSALFGLEPLAREPTGGHSNTDSQKRVGPLVSVGVGAATSANQGDGKTAGCTHAQCGQFMTGPLPQGSGLLQCSACKSVAYCGVKCQKRDWKVHKHQCGALRLGKGGTLKLQMQQPSPPAPFTAKQQGLVEKVRTLRAAERWEELNRIEVREVLEVAEELRSLKPSPDSWHPAVEMMLNLAYSLDSELRRSEAVGLTEKAKEYASEVGDRMGLLLSYNDLGNRYSLLGRYEDAIMQHYVAVEIEVERGLRELQGSSVEALGVCYQGLKKFDMAMTMYEEALAIHQFAPEDHARVLNCKGECCRHLEKYEMAVTYHKQAWDLLKPVSARDRWPLLRALTGVTTGQPVESEQAECQARTALLVGAALWAKAQVEMRDALPEQASSTCARTLHEAEEWLRTAQDLGVKIGFKVLTRNSQALLASLVLAKGEESEAVDLLVQHFNDWMEQSTSGQYDSSTSEKYHCVGCMQVGETMPTCSGCRVARSV